MSDTTCADEMPKYKSHKTVWALKIKTILRDAEIAQQHNRETDGSALITPFGEGYAPFKVDGEYLRKHKPEAGGYYVVYKDGYKSFSPDKAFEEGYSSYPAKVTEVEQGLLSVIAEVAEERGRQDGKWGGPDHDDKYTPAEFVQWIKDYAGWTRQMASMGSTDKARKRLIQVAALAVAAVESIDRKSI